MPVDLLEYEVSVPANSSRFFASREEALDQPTAEVCLAWSEEDPFIFNQVFDPGLIRHDDSYCTSVVDLDQVVQVPTTSYFFERVVPHLVERPRIVDIGCGQGEFVHRLAEAGFDAEGYDPVLRRHASNLHARYWTSDEPPADLYVMRCVLPHIQQPWAFLADVADSSPGCLALIEFQRTDWIVDNSIWYQISHDHVNQFRERDLAARYTVIDQGSFANGEWAWMLIKPGDAKVLQTPLKCDMKGRFKELATARSAMLEALKGINRPVAIWGAAGKGIVLAHAICQSRDRVTAIDADPLKWGLFLEGSGVQVHSPDSAMQTLPSDTLVIVSNPNHLAAVERRVSGRWPVALAADLGREPARGPINVERSGTS